MKKAPSPRTPKHGRGPFGRSASPRKAQPQQQLLRAGSSQVTQPHAHQLALQLAQLGVLLFAAE